MDEIKEKLDKILSCMKQGSESTVEKMKKIAVVCEDGVEKACVKGVTMEYDQAYNILNASTNRKRLNGAMNGMWSRDEQVKLYVSTRRMPTNAGCRVITNKEIKKLLEIVLYFGSLKPLASEKEADNITSKHREWISKNLTSTREAYHPNKKERTAQRQKIGRERRKASKEKRKTDTKKNQAATNEKNNALFNNILTVLDPMVYNEWTRRNQLNETENLPLQNIAEKFGLSVESLDDIFTNDGFIRPNGSKYCYPVDFSYEINQLIHQLTYVERQQVYLEDEIKKTDMKVLMIESSNDANLIEYLLNKYTVRVGKSITVENHGDTVNDDEKLYRFAVNSIRNTFIIKTVNDLYDRALNESTGVTTVLVKDVLEAMQRLPLCGDLGSEWLTTKLKNYGYLDKNAEKEENSINATIKFDQPMISRRCWQCIVKTNLQKNYK